MIRLNEKWAVGRIDTPPQWTLCLLWLDKGKEAWRPVSFCQTKAALLVAINEKVAHGAAYYPGKAENLAVSGEAMAKIEGFPDRVDQ